MYKVKCIDRSENNRFALTKGKTYIIDKNGMQTDDFVWKKFLEYSGTTPLDKFFNFCDWVNKDPYSGELIFEKVLSGIAVRRF